MEATMMESSKQMKYVEEENISGQMENSTMGNGRKTKCMAMEF
jgi:hypothetical protein